VCAGASSRLRATLYNVHECSLCDGKALYKVTWGRAIPRPASKNPRWRDSTAPRRRAQAGRGLDGGVPEKSPGSRALWRIAVQHPHVAILGGSAPENAATAPCSTPKRRQSPWSSGLDGSLPAKPPLNRPRRRAASKHPVQPGLDSVMWRRCMPCSTACSGRAPGNAVLDGVPPSRVGQDRP